jgi:chaperonin cofactor prefoldin
MTPELIAILSVGVGLAVVNLTGLQLVLKQFDRVNQRIDRLDERVDRLDGRMDRLDERVDRLHERMSNLEQRQARLEGLLDGLREALFSRASG